MKISYEQQLRRTDSELTGGGRQTTDSFEFFACLCAIAIADRPQLVIAPNRITVIDGLGLRVSDVAEWWKKETRRWTNGFRLWIRTWIRTCLELQVPRADDFHVASTFPAGCEEHRNASGLLVGEENHSYLQ
jgi:hypothetical protein